MVFFGVWLFGLFFGVVVFFFIFVGVVLIVWLDVV